MKIFRLGARGSQNNLKKKPLNLLVGSTNQQLSVVFHTNFSIQFSLLCCMLLVPGSTNNQQNNNRKKNREQPKSSLFSEKRENKISVLL